MPSVRYPTPILIAIVLTISANPSSSFTPLRQNNPLTTLLSQMETTTTALYGSWGKRVKEFTDDEFAREGGDRRAFDSYELQERGDFMRRVREDQKKLLKRKEDDFMAIAEMAGLSDQSGDGVQPMGNFDVMGDFGDDEDDIDVSVRWDDNDAESDSANRRTTIDADSITRMDGDIDVAGKLGQW
mmetsp:Transcript_16736/g.20892  ORF Transcript_16736/g.20892 Transcript_16736/m.20892 type:complete len:185 (+) Transcript_16736:127-681(+)|eukprot:CAMPEP_0172496780 /NCGR_PEP_ID=MMETSP1066-20121228/92885_1 /TAXON_ID=671091 /ORGANISM="Coscinodiscus wailesii, Strain CCMP2513" /LENGTH=184 /DNA_ID=CAMNT_0013269239 /DNA_START=127 /DNA_END=681 /DNA_ORIENTATION=+